MEQAIEAVKNMVVQQAKHFLTEAGEFYPFGAVQKADGTLVPVVAGAAEDLPESQPLLELLEQSIRHQLTTGVSNVGAIGLDVRLRFSLDTPATDALQIRLLTAEGYSVDYFMTYRLAEDRLICDPLFEETGTFTLD
ncbi:hypothetical protein LRS06_19825 [Hymenobacter sp. J193]|uniref:hypothetical protein n=1 Tax=Hymenobacter sp. J193 TaxID=2898429 RepID=UPI002150EEC9|nr:hypothetical protein [Hymenobacter sp. J193]MCR5889979.1 hypothetical protein [Hymenobacter sp. J193]